MFLTWLLLEKCGVWFDVSMRLENLKDGGHDKVIWSREHSRDGIRDKASRQLNSKTWGRRTTATLLGVSFGSYRRRRRDALMAHGGYVPLRRLGDEPVRRHWVFHLRLVWDVLIGPRDYVPMKCHHNIPIRRREDEPLRRLGDVPLRRHWVFH